MISLLLNDSRIIRKIFIVIPESRQRHCGLLWSAGNHSHPLLRGLGGVLDQEEEHELQRLPVHWFE